MGSIRASESFIAFPREPIVVIQLVAHRHHAIATISLQTISTGVTCSGGAIKHLLILAIKAKDIIGGTRQHGRLSTTGTTDTITAALATFNS